MHWPGFYNSTEWHGVCTTLMTSCLLGHHCLLSARTAWRLPSQYAGMWLGLPLKISKIEGLIKKLIFLGIMLDKNLMEISLPEVKLHQLKLAITE